MAANVRRNSTNIEVPTVTIVESTERTGSCCGCVSESVGVFAILSVYFFLGMFYAAASFVSLGFYDDAAVKVLLIISGCLHTFLALASSMGVVAIKKENIVMMRRLSIAFWILTALMFILSVVSFALQVMFKSSLVQACEIDRPVDVNCNQYVNDTLISEAIKFFIIESISIYFAFVIYRYAIRMKQSPLPFAAPVDGQKTPMYPVYTTHPPTSNDWVPPPTYTVRATNPLPDDFNPDSKQALN